MWGTIALLIFIGIIIALYFLNLLVPVALFIGAALLILIFYKFFVKKFEPFEAAMVYRFGRFQRVSPSGWAVVIPIIEKVGGTVDLREQQEHLEIPIISREGLKINMIAIVQYYVDNAVKAILNVKNYREMLLEIMSSRFRDLAAEFTFTQLMINVEDIAAAMKEQIAAMTDNWGLTVTAFEIESIQPPQEVLEALRGKRVAAEMLETKRFVAEARRIITAALGEGTKSFDDKTISYLYVKALENMKSAKMMVPTEFLDVVKPGTGNLAKSMIAGTTFNKALNMIGDEIKSEASVGKPAIKHTLQHIERGTKHSGQEEEHEEQEHTHTDKAQNEEEDEKEAAAADRADGSLDGHYDEEKKLF